MLPTITSRLTKSLLHFTTYPSSTQFAGFTPHIYQKLTITRLPHQTFTIFIDTNDKVSVLFNHLQKLFPQSKFIATTEFNNKLGAVIGEDDNMKNEEIKQFELIEVLIHSNLLVYEQHSNVFNLCLGVEIQDYHMTNNRNLPEHIAENVIKLAEEWRTDRSVEYAISKTQAYNEQQHAIQLQQKEELLSEIHQSYQNYLQMYSFYTKEFLQTGKARGLMANLIALMTVNWFFLFGVTYGGYSWNVGEPLSYLTMLGVDLVAMLGIFEMNNVVENTGKADWRAIVNRMNLKSLLRNRQFLIAYGKRHY